MIDLMLNHCGVLILNICHFKFQNFLLSNDIEPEGLDDTSNIKLYMVSLYDKSNILMNFYEGNQIKFVTPNIHLAGSFIQSLAKFMNMDNLQVGVHLF